MGIHSSCGEWVKIAVVMTPGLSFPAIRPKVSFHHFDDR